MSTQGFAAFLCDALRPLGPVTARRMFSGAGLFCDGLMFGLVFQDTLYLKADAETQRMFEAEGMGPFVYEARGRKVALGYWRIPERLLDEPDDLVAWARIALGVALGVARQKARAKQKTAAKPRKKAPVPLARSRAAKPRTRKS